MAMLNIPLKHLRLAFMNFPLCISSDVKLRIAAVLYTFVLFSR